MGGHGGLNILPQKRWNVYNYENREKVRRDEEAAAREEQLKREQQRKRDAELRLEHLRTARGLAPLTKPPEPDQKTEPEPEKKSNHINLFEGIKIFDPVEVEAPKKAKKVKKEEVRVVTAEDEKYRLGYGVAGKGTKVPWYLEKKSADVDDERVENEDDRRVKEGKRKRSGKKTLEELREERLRRENKEKERERQLLREMSRRDGGFSRRERLVLVD